MLFNLTICGVGEKSCLRSVRHEKLIIKNGARIHNHNSHNNVFQVTTCEIHELV